MKKEKAVRVSHVHEVEIKADPEGIFPLACPVEERKWIDQWEYDLVYSKSGVNEDHCIFREEMSGPVLFGRPLTTLWITRMHDSENKKILFVMVTGDASVIDFTFELKKVRPGASWAVFEFVYTSLNEEGARQSEGELKGKLAAIQTFLADSLRHYCETGEVLKG